MSTLSLKSKQSHHFFKPTTSIKPTEIEDALLQTAKAILIQYQDAQALACSYGEGFAQRSKTLDALEAAIRKAQDDLASVIRYQTQRTEKFEMIAKNVKGGLSILDDEARKVFNEALNNISKVSLPKVRLEEGVSYSHSRP